MYSIKVTHNGEVRRTQVALDGTVTTAYEQLIQTVRNMFPDLYLNKAFCLTWQDDEGDTVTVSSEMELSEAVRVMSTMYGGAALRFAVKKVDAPAAPAPAAATAKPAGPTGAFVAGMDQQAAAAASAKEEAAVHYGVTCDECGAHPIIGVRYHCTVRHNFDLCSACFNKKAQPYSMIKLEEPMGRHGRRLGDRCARKAAKMAAKEAAANAAAAEGGVPQGHPWAHHLHGRHRGMHGHHGHGPHGGRGGRFHWFGPAGEGIPYESCEDYYGPAAEGEEQQQQEKEGSETSPAAADANKKVPAAAAAAAAAGFVPPPFPPPGMHGPGPHFGTVGPPGYGAAGPLPHLGPGCPPPPFGGPHPHGGPHPFGGPHGHPFGPHAGPHHGPHHGPPGAGGRGGPIHGGMLGGRGPFGGRGGHGPHGGRGPFGGPWGVPPPAGSTPLASAVPIPVDASSTSEKATKGTTAAPAPAVEKKLRCEEVSTHYGVTCDACGRCPIVGARYKCTVREDFDLCATCFGADLQSYPMVLFAYPGDIGTLVEPIIPPIVRDLNDEDAGLQAAIGESLCRSQVSDVTASVDEPAEEEEPNTTTTTTTDAAADLSYTFVDLGLASSPSPVTPKSAPAALPAPPALSAAEAARIAAEEAALARAEAERAALLAAWAKELGLLADMGFSDFDAVLPLLQEHVGTPASQGGDQGSRAAKAVEGMQTVVATLLLGQSGIRR